MNQLKLRNVNTHSEQTQNRLSVLESFFTAFDLASQTEQMVVSDIINTQRNSHLHARIKCDITKKMCANNPKNIAIFGTRNFNTLTEEKDILCAVNFDYESKVNSQLDRENKDTQFTAQSRVWGQHVTSGIVVNGTTLYLSLSITKSDNKKYYNENEIEVDVNEYNTWLQPSQRSEYKQAKAQERQGTDNVINYINLKTSSIIKLYHNKQVFDVEHDFVSTK